jgi:putative redox protein
MAKVINIKNLPVGYQSIISNGKHSIVGDEPIKSKGTDLGFSPEDLILSSLAMCKVATVRFIARKHGWDSQIRDVDAELSMKVKRGRDGALSTKVTVAIKIEGDISEEQKAELIKQADSCYIHRMIEGDWDIEAATELVPTTEIESV